jgi:outer membrane protein OmpA-like peptidoglycan-associated protein
MGPTGVMGRWTSFRDFWFAADRWDMQSSDAGKVSEISQYMSQNPSLRLAIDGSMDPRDPRGQELGNRRVSTVRDALIQAGVPAHRIQTGAFSDSARRNDRRVEVLISSGN